MEASRTTAIEKWQRGPLIRPEITSEGTAIVWFETFAVGCRAAVVGISRAFQEFRAGVIGQDHDD